MILGWLLHREVPVYLNDRCARARGADFQVGGLLQRCYREATKLIRGHGPCLYEKTLEKKIGSRWTNQNKAALPKRSAYLT